MKKFFTLIAAVASVITAFAGNTLVNADFAEGKVAEVNIATYVKDIADGVANMQAVPGWTFGVENVDTKAAGVAAYGSATSLGGEYYAPAAGPEGSNGNALGMVAVWGGNVLYTQDVTLPQGAYTMTVPVCNTAGTSAFVKNLIGVKYGATEKYATTMLYPVNTWKTEVIAFELAEETTVTVSLGYNGANVGSSASQHLFIDCVKLETVSALDLAKTEALKALPVSNGTIFTPSAADIEAVKAAIEAATTVEEIEAAVPAEWNIPALKGNYYVKNTNGEAYLSEAKLSAEPVAIKFEKAEGGFYINVNGNYLNMKGGDTWSMTATDTPVAVWNFNLNDGKYTIQGPNGLIGSDNLGDGSATYGNKKINETGKNIFWTVETAPEMSEYTVYAKVTADGQSKTFVGQELKVATLDGVATVTLPAAKAGPYTMESQTVKVNIDGEGNISEIEGQTLNFKEGATDILVTVTNVTGTLAEGKVEVFVIASGDNGKDVNVIYSTDEPAPEIKTITVDFTQFGDGVDATGAEPINAEEGVFEFVGNNSKVTLTKSGFYTGGNTTSTARYITVTPTFNGTLTVEGTASGDNTDRYIFVATAPGADETASTVLKSAAIPEKGVRHSFMANLEAGKTYYVCMHGNGTITNLSYTNDPTPVNTVKAAVKEAMKAVKYVKNGRLVIEKNGKKYNAAGAEM